MREQNSIENEVKNLERWAESRKTTQFAGSSDVIAKPSATANTWDVNETVNGTLGIMEYSFIFIADTQLAPFVSFHPDIQLDNVTFDGTQDTIIDLSAGFSIYGGFASPVELERSAGLSVFIYSMNPSDFNLKIKMHCEATDVGRIEFQRVR